MEKRKLETLVLDLARPILHKIYGGYSIDKYQTDRPDAAIFIKKPHKTFGNDRAQFKVAVEITTVDPQETLSYLNDERFGREAINDQINDLIVNDIDSLRPFKKIDTKIPKEYIYLGVKNKSKKYDSYTLSGEFREVVLLCFSKIIDTDNKIFINGLRTWTEYLLSQNEFPFDKVVFVGLDAGKPICIYDKKFPVRAIPKSYEFENSSITSSQGPFLKVGKEYNLREILNQEAMISKKKK